MTDFAIELRMLIDMWLTSGTSIEDIVGALLDELDDLQKEDEDDV